MTMRRLYLDILLQLLIFVCLAVVLMLMMLTQRREPGLSEDFQPKVPVQYNSWLEQSVRADLMQQHTQLSKRDVAKLVANNQQLMREYGFNMELSKLLSYIRKLPDARHEQCQKVSYNITNGPTASIIIVFHNVPLSMVLRTLHSAVRRSEESLLKDVVLVDDGSTLPDLSNKLDYYVRTRFRNNVKLSRNSQRLGLPVSRLLGAGLSTGEVLIFMDAYSEPNVGWLIPLLHRIRESPTSVVLPVLDAIDPNYLMYKKRKITIGGFSWNGQYRWHTVSQNRMDDVARECRQPLPTCPLSSPTMPPGTVYAIARTHFNDMTYFDEMLVTSGGDTLDMSFSVWLCSGKIEVVPCSRVGRVQLDARYKDMPKTTPMERGNVAMSWWGQRQKLFFYYFPLLTPKMFDAAKVKRDTVRDFLNCKTMDWYLSHIYPEKLVPSLMANSFGRIKLKHGSGCLRDELLARPGTTNTLLVVPCGKSNDPASLFFFTKQGQLRSEFHCMVVDHQKPSLPQLVLIVPCIEIASKYSSKWAVHLNHVSMGVNNRTLCLDMVKQNNHNYPVLLTCNHKRVTQRWTVGGSIIKIDNEKSPGKAAGPKKNPKQDPKKKWSMGKGGKKNAPKKKPPVQNKKPIKQIKPNQTKIIKPTKKVKKPTPTTKKPTTIATAKPLNKTAPGANPKKEPNKEPGAKPNKEPNNKAPINKQNLAAVQNRNPNKQMSMKKAPPNLIKSGGQINAANPKQEKNNKKKQKLLTIEFGPHKNKVDIANKSIQNLESKIK